MSLSGGLEPLHTSLPLAGGLVRVLRAVFEVPVLPMFHPRKDFALGGAVARQFVGDEYPWHVHQALEELTEEFLRRPLIPAALHQDIKYVPILIYGTPEITAFAFDGEEHFIHMPFVAGPRPAATELIGIQLAKLAAPLPNRFIGHAHAAFEQYFLHIAEAEAEAEVQPHRMANDFAREPVILIPESTGNR